MRPSSDLGTVDGTRSIPGGDDLASEAVRPSFSPGDLARAINRRLAELGSTVTAEVDRPPRDRTHLRLRAPPGPSPGSATGWEEEVRVSSLSDDRDAAVAEVLAAIDSKRWEPALGSTLRLARSSVWCDPL